jgi:hypothetical protein
MCTAREVPTPLRCLAQAMRLLLDDLEYGFAEGADELFRIDRPDAADHAGAEIFLDPLDRRWCGCLQERGFVRRCRSFGQLPGRIS